MWENCTEKIVLACCIWIHLDFFLLCGVSSYDMWSHRQFFVLKLVVSDWIWSNLLLNMSCIELMRNTGFRFFLLEKILPLDLKNETSQQGVKRWAHLRICVCNSIWTRGIWKAQHGSSPSKMSCSTNMLRTCNKARKSNTLDRQTPVSGLECAKPRALEIEKYLRQNGKIRVKWARKGFGENLKESTCTRASAQM